MTVMHNNDLFVFTGCVCGACVFLHLLPSKAHFSTICSAFLSGIIAPYRVQSLDSISSNAVFGVGGVRFRVRVRVGL